MGLSQKLKTLLETMNGSEIYSVAYEGCVQIQGDQVIREGKVIDTLNTSSKITSLWNDLCEQEGI